MTDHLQKTSTSGETQTRGGVPEFSILIGLVSTEDSDRILQTLESLRNQQGSHSYEVIIGDRRHDEISSRIDAEFQEVRRIPCPPDMSLPELRTRALDEARGTYIVVTEDHCVPSGNWLFSMAQAFSEAPDGTVAVGGCVENGVHDTALDWATFLCEYSFFIKPVEEGVTTVLPGMNVAYHHSIFDNLDRKLLTSGFWETTVHPVLVDKGLKLYSSNSIVLYHCKKFSRGLFARQRFIYSRYYAGLRFRSDQILKRIFACGATILLPPLLLYRISRQVRAKGRLASEFRSALPDLLLFYIIWAYGEMVGYILGTGDALARIE
ncbi:MAG: glycosyltransferase [Gammaproteobacteria bacterium]|nr:glycosyltransferase [Gammaproteobacteria bacterium]